MKNEYKIYSILFISIFLISCFIILKLSFDTEKNYTIAIYREENFPTSSIPKNISPEWLKNNLSDNYEVVFLNSKELNEKGFSPQNYDLFILPYGATFPLEEYNNIKKYIKNGGGFLNLAGIPFWQPVKKVQGEWKKVEIKNKYEKFLAPLGIKYYKVEINQNNLHFNKSYFPKLANKNLNNLSSVGLTATTSFGGRIKKPVKGNVFPGRVPCRNFVPLATLYNGKSEQIASSITMLESWDNPYGKKNIPRKWGFIGVKGKSHPLTSQWKYSKEFFVRLVNLLTYPLILYNTATKLASYKQGETVKFSTHILNNSNLKKRAVIEFRIFNEADEKVFQWNRYIKISPNEKFIIKNSWSPKEFKDDFYRIEARLKKSDKIMDKSTNGFVVRDKKILKQGVNMQVENNKILINNKKSFIYGTNYYESKLGELMWLRPNILSIKRDFEKMHNMGINFVRLHYHHSKWFRDYLKRIDSNMVHDEYFDVSDSSYLPSKRSLRILDAIVQLAQKYKLILSLDIFSLVPKEMGNPIGWLGMSGRFINKEKIKRQKQFVDILARRYKEVPGISWDLWNEPRVQEKLFVKFQDWVREIIREFRKNGDQHPITVGGETSLKLLSLLDYGCIHTYNPGEFESLNERFDKPIIFQEEWNAAGCSLEEENRQAKEIEEEYRKVVKSGAQGFMPWQWTRQSRLWNHMFDTERWDDELGVITHGDGTVKPAGRVYDEIIKNKKR